MIEYEQIVKILRYDPDTGDLVWLENMSTRARKGDVAGVVQCGKYRRVGIYGKYYMAHRLAWLISFKRWPNHQIDHINGIKDDNRLQNLREATSQQNNRNTLHANKSGKIGAAYRAATGKYIATIRDGEGKRRFLGIYETAEAASNAYIKASLDIHGEFSVCRKISR